MARKSREVSGTGIYHVMMRGTNRQEIFEEGEDYVRFLAILRNMVYPIDDRGKRLPSRCCFYAYCLMTNHVHLLVREAEDKIGPAIHRIATTYAHYYNNKYVRFGHLFQDRFRSEPVNDQEYFFTLLRYIHQNPMTAGLSKGIDDYDWSSWKEYENHMNGEQDICTIKHVIARMPFEELRKLVSDPLPKTLQILDFDDGKVNLTDAEVKDFLINSFGLKQPTYLQLYSRERRNDILRETKQFGASIRQLVRLKGLSFAIVRDA
jgi:REP element-mobilizing transposase RayT